MTLPELAIKRPVTTLMVLVSIVVLGVVVGGMIVAMYLPIFNMIGSVEG